MYNYLVIKNLTRDVTISEKAKKALSFTDKTFGMILPKNSDGLIFKTRYGIHTFFMKDSVDVLILDSNNCVVRIVNGLKPNRIFLWNPKFNTVAELPNGRVEKTKTKVGDKISLV
jgi:uncharacterized membrane protein (UPF0127 family)